LRIISEKALRDFARTHTDAVAALSAWKRIVRSANWKTSADVRATFSSSDLVGEKTVFNIARNRYRMITFSHFRRRAIYVKAILTHKEYDKGEWKR